MKTKQLLIIPALLLLVFSGCNVNNRGKVKHPAFIAWSSMTLEVDQVELTDTTTVLYIKAYYPPKNWIKIDPDSYLADENGNQYPIRSSEGIVLGEEFYMPESGETAFVLTFPAIPATVSSIDFSEGNFDGAFNIWGIRLTDKKWPAPELPKGFTKPLAGEHAVLPQPEFKNGTARIDGRILNYQKGMPKELSVQLSSPFNSDAATLQIDEKGLFSGEIEAFSTHPATVYLFGQGIQCFVAPGETTSLIINPVEVSRRQSRLRVDEESGGEPVYHGGYLAALSRELSGVQAVYSLNSFESYESFLSFLKSIENKNPEELKHLFLENYREKQTVLDTLNVSPAGKQYLACATDLYYAQQISSITSYIDRAYIHKNNLMENREAMMKYYETRKWNLAEDFYHDLQNLPLINDPRIMYIPEISYYISGWQITRFQSEFVRALGTDQGILFDLLQTADAYHQIKEFSPLDEPQIEQLPATFREYILKKNNDLLQLIEENREKTDFTTGNMEKMSENEVFPFILSKYKGKVLLVDIWATWCGPCRQANREMQPLKAELADKDIAYVYVAGENSPLNTWKNMIPDLHGEHFRLSEKQWDYVWKTFHINGVPTYFFIDKQGNIRHKQTGYPGASTMKEKLVQLLEE